MLEAGNVFVPAERVWVFGLSGLVFHRLVGLHICLGGGITVLSLAWNVIFQYLVGKERTKGKYQRCAERLGNLRLAGS